MKLEFGPLSIRRFKSFTADEPVVLDLPSFGVGAHFLRGRNKVTPELGSNGAGKSSVWDAMSWCLWGRTPSGLRNPDIRPWSGKGRGTEVQQTVLIDGKEHVVARTAHPNSLRIDDEDVGQEAVEQLLGLNYATFVHTVLFGQGQPLFPDLAPKDKMQLFVDALELDRWDALSERTGARVAELEAEQDADTSRKERALGGIDAIKEAIAKAREQSDDWTAEQAKAKRTLERDLKTATEDYGRVKTKLGAAELAYEGASVELRAQDAAMDKCRDAITEARVALTEAQAGVAQKQQRIEELTGTLEQFDGDNCPVCGQPAKGSQLDKHKREMRAEIKELEKAIAASNVKKLQAAVTKATDAFEEARETKRSFIDRADKAEAALSSLRTDANRAKNFRDRFEADLKRLEETVNPFRETLSELRSRKTDAETTIAEAEERLTKRGASIERFKFWVKGFKDIRLLIIDEVIQELNMVANAMIEDTGLVGWTMQFATEKESKSGTTQRMLNLTILSPANKEPVRWESWSGGEGQRLRVIGGLALSEVLLNHAGVSVGMEVLDEPTSHLSTEGVRDLCDFLADRARTLGLQIWYVDHMAVESARFASVVTVVKTKHGSEIVT